MFSIVYTIKRGEIIVDNDNNDYRCFCDKAFDEKEVAYICRHNGIRCDYLERKYPMVELDYNLIICDDLFLTINWKTGDDNCFQPIEVRRVFD
jgi:hypothetical protein